jgi:hypothetical protein
MAGTLTAQLDSQMWAEVEKIYNKVVKAERQILILDEHIADWEVRRDRARRDNLRGLYANLRVKIWIMTAVRMHYEYYLQVKEDEGIAIAERLLELRRANNGNQ